MYHMPSRLDIDLLDPDDPFEVDEHNWPHLYKHAFAKPDGRVLTVDLADVLDRYVWNAVVFYPADPAAGDAHWLMVTDVEGIVVTVPIAPARDGDPKKCRPIGLYEAAASEQDSYRRDA